MIIMIIFYFLIAIINLNAQEFQWAENITNAGFGDVAVDANGNIFTIGTYSGNVSMGGTTLISAGSSDGYMTKHDKDGNFIWLKPVGSGIGSQGLRAIQVDTNGDLILGGYFGTSIDFGGGNFFTTIAGVQNDIYVVKYDNDGNLIWVSRYGGDNFDRCFDLKLDSQDNILITGIFRTTISFDAINITSIGSDEIYITKIDNDGNVLWANRGGTGTSNDYGQEIAIDSDNNVYTTGFVGNGNADFGGFTLTNQGSDDCYIVKYDSDGNALWAKLYGGTSGDRGAIIAVDSENNAYLGGYFQNSIVIGSQTLTSIGGRDLFLVKLDELGNEVWVKHFSSTNNLSFQNMETDSDGNLFLSAYYISNLTIFDEAIIGSGTNSAALAKFDTNGNLIWLENLNATTVAVNAFSFNIQNQLVLCGSFSGSLQLGNTTLNTGSGFLTSAIIPIYSKLLSFNDIQENSANVNYFIGNDGGSPITQSGLVYSNSQNPTISDNKIISGNISGLFDSEISNLQTRTQYYVRSFVTNSLGTTYSEQSSFTTLISDEDYAPNNGDGNGDGTADSYQNNVLSIYNPVSETYMTLVNDKNIEFIETYIEADKDESYAYPYGKTEFKINASKAEVKVYYHGIESLDSYVYRKLFPDNTYKQFENVVFSTETIGGNQVAVATLTLTDGGLGDYDGIVNGVIYDPGGPAIPITANIPIWDWWYSLLLIPIMIYSYKRFS